MQLLCVGDVALTEEGLSPWALPRGVTPGETARVLLNWELPIGDTINPVPRSSGARLLAHPSSVTVVRNWSPGFATLATNHILDAGEGGLSYTIQSLNQAGFVTVGAGRIQDEIAKPLCWETAEGLLAIVNWVFPETHPDWMSVPGPNCWPGLQEAKRTIKNLKRLSDWVMIVVHWSDELFSYPRPEDRATARALAASGADLVIGHHPHVVRGMEHIGLCPIFYSIGNYCFSDIPDGRGGWVSKGAPRNREALGVDIAFRRGEQPACRAVSFWKTEGQQVGLDPHHRAERRMARASRPLHQFLDSAYVGWYEVERARFDRWGAKWHFGVRRLGLRGSLQRLFQKAVTKLEGVYA